MNVHAPQDIEVARAVARLRASRGGQLLEQRAAETELAGIFVRNPAHRDTVVRELMPIAELLARRFYRGGEGMDDLRQVAALGLLKALAGFDPERGSAFVAYAIPTIQGELRRHFRDHAWAAHVPRRQQELAQLVTGTARRLQVVLGREASVAEVAEELKLDCEAVVDALAASHAMHAWSLDAPLDDGDEPGGAPRIQVTVGEHDPGFQRAEDRATIAQLIRDLPERDRTMLALRYGGELSQSVIGAHVGLSQMHVSRSLRRIVAGLSEAAAEPAD